MGRGPVRQGELRLVPLDRAEADQLRQQLSGLASRHPQVAAELLAIVERRTVSESKWRFILVGAAEDEAVVRWLTDHAKRLRVSLRLWARMKRRIRSDTNEILLTRAEMMAVSGASSSHVSEALAELVSIKAIKRQQEGREVRWFLNDTVATHRVGADRDAAQAEAPPLLPLMEGSLPVR